MKWAFWGTDEFATTVLDTLKKAGLKPDLIISVPDQARDRDQNLIATPTKIWAQANQIPCLQPESLRKDFVFPAGPWDFFLVASYGKIIPQAVLDLPSKGTLNIHPSLLPLYRGPSPLEAAILNGDPETGVTIIEVDAEMDHGPIVDQQKLTLGAETDYLTLRQTLAVMGVQLVVDNLPNWLAGTLKASGQDHQQASFTRKFVKNDGLLDLTADSLTNYRHYLALNPWPGVFTYLKNGDKEIRVVIKKAHLEDGHFIIDQVIPEGRKLMTWADFKRGQH